MTPPLKITILGCGTSPGVPRIGPNWGACDPNNPRNRRRRAAILIEREGEGGTTRVLVDMGPDIREQILDVGIDWVDGVLVTHAHADHVHGIDDLRGFFNRHRRRVSVYMNESTADRVTRAFDYCFEGAPGSGYPPIMDYIPIQAGVPVEIDGPGGSIRALPFEQTHGSIMSLGFRIGNFAYSSDVSDLSEETVAQLNGLDTWILDALRYEPHPSHFSVTEALDWVDRLKPRHSVFTHLDIPLDYETLRADLPEGVEPAYDGMVLRPLS